MFARGWQTWDLARSHESLLGGNDAAPGTGDVDRAHFSQNTRERYTPTLSTQWEVGCGDAKIASTLSPPARGDEFRDYKYVSNTSIGLIGSQSSTEVEPDDSVSPGRDT
jgi:hypothetical protein